MSLDLSGKISGIESLITTKVGNKSLSDGSVGPEVFRANGQIENTVNIDTLSFGFGVSGNVIVNVFNSSDDKDKGSSGEEDETVVLALPTTTTNNSDNMILTPPLMVDYANNSVVVKTTLLAKVSGNLSGSFSPLIFSIDGSKQIELSRYTTHSRSDNAFDTILNSLKNFDYAISSSAIKQIAAQQALSYRLTGNLTSSISISYSDIITGNLSILSNFVKKGELFAFKATASASVDFKLAISGDFLLIFTREDANNIKISLKKATSREIDIGFSAGVEVGFKDPSAITKLATDFLTGISGKATQLIDQIMATPNKLFNELTDLEKDLVKWLAERIGLNSALNDLNVLRQKWQEIINNLTSNIKKVVETKIQFMFQASYNRISSKTSILEAVVSENLIDTHHKELLLCNIDGILDKIRANSNGYKLIRYFHQEILEKVLSWGFIFSFGKVGFSSRDTINKRKVTLENINKEQKITYTATRKYESNWFGDKESWLATFKSEMDSFKSVPQTTDFRYGLSLKLSRTEKNLSKDELRRFLDYALIWKVINKKDLQEIAEKHANQTNGEKTEFSLDIEADDETFRKLATAVKTASIDDIAIALGRAMPWTSVLKDKPVRSDVDIRTTLYAPLWKAYLQNPSNSLSSYANMAANFLSNQPNGNDAVFFEQFRDGAGNFNQFSFPWIIQKDGSTSTSDNSGIAKKWNNFKKGMSNLHDVIQPGQSKEVKEIENIFNLLEPFWSQSFFMYAVGALFVNLATKGNYLEQLKCSLTIKFPDIVKDNTHLYSTSN